MTASQATAEVFFTTFNALPKKEKNVLLGKLMQEIEFREDLIDIAILE